VVTRRVHDSGDFVAAIHARRLLATPQAYLDPTVRAGISMLACAGEPTLAGGLRRLAADLRSGKWHERHAELLGREQLDTGYRLLIRDHG